MRIFLSYRRGDTAGYAGRLYDGLVDRLGADNVFHDISVIPPGQDFTVVLDRALDQSDAVLAVIGPAWLGATTFDGRPRLKQPDDYVRLELAHALDRDMPLVPVLVGGAELPPPEQLPEPLKGLVNRQAFRLHDDSWRQDVDDLVERLGATGAVAGTRRRWPLIAAMLAAAVVLLGGVWWALAGGAGRDAPLASGTEPVAERTVAAADPTQAAQDLPTAVTCGPPAGDGWSALPIGENASGGYPEGAGLFVFSVLEGSYRPLASGKWAVVLQTTMENATGDDAYHGEWNYDSLVVGQRSFPHTCFAPTPELVAPNTIGDAIIGFETRCEPTGYVQLVLAQAKARIDVTAAGDPGPC